jgi:outer membrane protein
MQKNKLNKIALLFIAIAGSYNGMAQTKNEFSVQQAVDYGLKNATQVKNALIDIQNQQQANKEITSQALPQINGTTSVTDYLQIPVTPIPESAFNPSAPPGAIEAVPLALKYNSSFGVSLSQLLFDGRVFIGLQARASALNYYKAQAEVTKETIKANIYKIYYQLVVGEKQLASVQANVNNIARQLHDTKEIYKNGFAEKLDIDKLTVQLNNLQTQVLSIQNQLAAGNASLKFLINMPQKEELVLTDTLSDDDLKSGILDSSYNYNDRKDIQLYTTNVKLQEYNVKQYKLNKIPTLAAVASYSKTAYASDLSSVWDTWYPASYIGINLNVPIFGGFYKNAKIQEAKYSLRQANNNLAQLKSSVDNDVAQARINMKTALATIDNQKQNIQLAENVFNSTTLKYAQGLGSNQEIYDAQTQLQVAQNNYYNALYDAIIAKINYLQAVGKL